MTEPAKLLLGIVLLVLVVGGLTVGLVVEVLRRRREAREAAAREVEARDRAAARASALDTAERMTDGQIVEWASRAERRR